MLRMSGVLSRFMCGVRDDGFVFLSENFHGIFDDQDTVMSCPDGWNFFGVN